MPNPRIKTANGAIHFFLGGRWRRLLSLVCFKLKNLT